MKIFDRLSSLLDYGVSTVVTAKSNINIDQEIHKAIFSAQEELLKETQIILDNVKSDDELGKPQYPQEEELLLEKLLSLGFTNQPQVVELQAKLKLYKAKLAAYNKEQANAKATVKLIQYYSGKYKNKFITIDSIKSICNRFGLLFAPIEMYSAEIPLKNMREIADFKCDVEDKLYKTRFSVGDRELISKYFSAKSKNRYRLETEELLPEIIRSKGDTNSFREKAVAQFLSDKYNSYISWVDISDVAQSKAEKSTSLTDGMMIAPKNKFNIPADYTVENGFEVGYKKLIEIKDPVVLQPVVGGYLIVSAWGFESTLPEINDGNTEFSAN